MSDNLDKVKLRRETIEGVQKSFNNLEQLSTVKLLWTKVKTSIYKKKGITYIGTKDPLDVGDVIQTGNYSIKYKIIKEIRLEDRGGYIYRIKRVDGYNTTSQDIDGSKAGQKINVVSRRTFEQIFNDTPHGAKNYPDYEKPDPACPEEQCCEPKDSSTSTTGNPEVYNYRLIVGARRSYTVNYVDENGEGQELFVPVSKTDQEFIFCALFGSIEIGGETLVAATETCPDTCTTPSGVTLESIGLCI